MSIKNSPYISAYLRAVIQLSAVFFLYKICFGAALSIWGGDVKEPAIFANPVFFLALCVFFSLMNFERYICITMLIKAEDSSSLRSIFIISAKKLRWIILEEHEDSLKFTPKFQWWLWQDKVQISFREHEIYITGPHEAVDRLLRKSELENEAVDVTDKQKAM